MALRVNPDLIDELELFGAKDVAKCYQCGNCSAACSHSDDPYVFPRKSMRYLQMGLEKPLRSALDPWLCYYCGKCSDQCPRGAEPGETMMGVRRWLTAQYDFTGLSRMLYRSWSSELTAVLGVALLTGAGFSIFGFFFGGGNLSVYDGPGAFLPAHAIHVFDWTMGAILGLLLLINCLRMWHFTMRNEHSVPVPASMYLHFLPLLPLHFFTQKRFRHCENKTPWANHLALVLSYLTMLVLIMVFLKYMQAGPQINWYVHVFGYLSAVGLVATSIFAIRGRLKRDAAYHRHSHESDWMFLGLLLFVTVTGILQHILHRAGLPMAANIIYIVHLMGVVPMLGLEVPFSKWSHLAYRPLAIYFSQLQQAAQAEKTTNLVTLQPRA
ncbi:MAG TPA: 4Fe-4S dicluster domain-containing protein [Candidatus Saccharimonadales bacterium]|nr:4Fe-4S dicluster domain-containing protein [Candidatus Saccharimonadales bacterium]